MDIERIVVSKVVFTGNVAQAISRHVEPEMFADDECRDVYRYILAYQRKYGKAPSLEVAKYDKPDFQWIQFEDSLDWALDRFAVLVKRRMADDMLAELALASNDPVRAESIDLEFLEVARKLVASVPTSEIERFSDIDQRIAAYHEDRKRGKESGFRFGYPKLDYLTGGLQRYELATVLGFTNLGKSTLLRSFGFNFWMQNHTPLYISLEMEAKVILRIFDAMAANLNYRKLKQLVLSDEELRNWEALAKRIKSKPCDIAVIDSAHRITPDRVMAEAVRHNPDIIILDYVQLMSSSYAQRGVKRYQQLSEITQDLKYLARTLKIPIVMAAQTNRSGSKEGAELDNVGDGLSISQDSDIVIGLHQTDAMAEANEMEIRLNKNRDGPRGRFLAFWNHEDLNFGEKQPLASSLNRMRAIQNGHEEKISIIEMIKRLGPGFIERESLEKYQQGIADAMLKGSAFV